MNTTCAEVPKTTAGTQIPFGFSSSGWIDIGVCTKCERTGSRYAVHPVNPCYECGSKVKERVGRWNAPVYASIWWRIAYELGLTDRQPKNIAGFWEVKP